MEFFYKDRSFWRGIRGLTLQNNDIDHNAVSVNNCVSH
ncbi:hypothetical protein AZ15_1927 [Bordetella bronchiseptica A1-7]|nr:hypothetical protein AZ15_1927 [Bordetella bronchiseptica A1-7]KDB73079.1 hypothetical protein AZ21_2263 [Bordetella bronchiseptica B20-10725633]